MGKRLCPSCSHKVGVEEDNAHIWECYKFANESHATNYQIMITLGSSKYVDNMVERQSIVYADAECSLLATNAANKVAHHDVNSARYAPTTTQNDAVAWRRG